MQHMARSLILKPSLLALFITNFSQLCAISTMNVSENNDILTVTFDIPLHMPLVNFSLLFSPFSKDVVTKRT